jgi:hypothetical protein
MNGGKPIVTDKEREQIETLMAESLKQSEEADELVAKNPGLSHVTAFIMAGDNRSAERAYAYLKSGEWDVEKAIWLTGSFARLTFAERLHKEGLLPLAKYHAMLPELWRGSDPDDTDPRWLALWKQARNRKGRLITDGEPLPERSMVNGLVEVYRGQPEGATLGIAWTTDKSIAEKFASGAGARVPTPGGVVVVGRIDPDLVLAYLTERGESEVIVDPLWVDVDHYLTGDI